MTDEELIERAVSDIRAACQQYCVADCDCSDFARELRSRWQSLTATESKLDHCLRVVREYVSSELADDPSQDDPSCRLREGSKEEKEDA